MKKLAYIVLNYNNYKDTLECVESIKRADYDNYFVVIVDNASTDYSFDKFNNRYQNEDNISIISSGKNIGYAGGNNVGIRYAIAKGAEIICVINNDTIIEASTPKVCAEYLQEDKNVAFVGPTILEFNEDIVQSTGGIVLFKKGGARLLNHGAKIENIKENVDCDFISGACLFFSVEVLPKIGLIPENYFLFYEETEWCYRAKKMGFKNVCLANAFIRHKGSVSIHKVSGLSDYLLHRNRVVFAKRNVASCWQFLLFLVYIYLEALYLLVTRKANGLNHIKFYHHGLFNIVDKRYPFIIINEENQIVKLDKE